MQASRRRERLKTFNTVVSLKFIHFPSMIIYDINPNPHAFFVVVGIQENPFPIHVCPILDMATFCSKTFQTPLL